MKIILLLSLLLTSVATVARTQTEVVCQKNAVFHNENIRNLRDYARDTEIQNTINERIKKLEEAGKQVNLTHLETTTTTVNRYFKTAAIIMTIDKECAVLKYDAK